MGGINRTYQKLSTRGKTVNLSRRVAPTNTYPPTRLSQPQPPQPAIANTPALTSGQVRITTHAIASPSQK